ncbi:uncharacterized protein LOC121374537 [Gigantopelta aegis]|uniref:uncharacterized protein LOC121374537 n=1 Tax=Gigantopelta aegis TaxID=1735272 RepID=UPI001B88D10B|nr:uncharacterized protein LOC121374537 [Gigantopelta aegis]
MAEFVANALNEIARCNLHGFKTDTDRLVQFALDYFNDDVDVESESDSDSDDVTEVVNGLCDTPDLGPLMSNLECLENEIDHVETVDSSDDDDVMDSPVVIVDETVNILKHVGEVVVSDSVKEEQERIKTFSCNCSRFKQGKCIKQFDVDYTQRLRMNIAALTNGEKDIYMMGKISCSVNMSKMTECSKRKSQEERKRFRTAFFIDKKVVCRNAFKFMHCIGNSRLNDLIHRYAEGDIGVRLTNAGGRIQSRRVLTFEDITRISTFITTFAEDHAIVLPERLPSFKRDDIKLLPSHETKSSVWTAYTAAMENIGERPAKLTSFRNI